MIAPWPLHSKESTVAKNFVDAERMTLAKLKRRPFLVKLRDGVARLLMPYL